VDVNLAQLADPPVAHELAGGAATGGGARFGAVLEHAGRAPHRVAARQVLGQADAERLLDVHVLARLHRRDGHGHVPVVGRGDAHRVNVVSREKLPEIHVGPAIPGPVAVVHGRLGQVAVLRPHVAHGDHPGIGAAQEHGQIGLQPLPPGADVAHPHALARRRRASSEDGGRNDAWSGRHGRSRPQESPPRRTLLLSSHSRLSLPPQGHRALMRLRHSSTNTRPPWGPTRNFSAL